MLNILYIIIWLDFIILILYIFNLKIFLILIYLIK